MREETQKPLGICFYCKLPITQDQTPCVGLEGGRLAHMRCFREHREEEKKRES